MANRTIAEEHFESIRPCLHGLRCEMDSGQCYWYGDDMGRTCGAGERRMDSRRVESHHSKAEGEGGSCMRVTSNNA